MPDNIEDWKKAGQIAAQVRVYGAGLIKKGASFRDVTEKIEAKIKELGAFPAFPPQMALNEIAAHFTVDPDEDIIFSDEIVSLDVGVCVNGAIGDTAVSVDLGAKNDKLLKASEDALTEAINLIKSGVLELGQIGKTIEDTIVASGFKPVKNLSGHGLGLYEIHTIPTIPNFDTGDRTELQPDTFFAIEPFASNGAGLIYEADEGNIFSVIEKKPVRSQITREVLKEIDSYNGLPFTTRWLAKKFPMFKINFALKDLLNNSIIRPHPPLIDKDKGLVSQAEHTIYLDENKQVFVLTELTEK